MAIDHVTDWGARLLTRFYEQFKGLPNLTALARDVCGPQFDALETAGQQLLTLASIDDSSGAQLALLGRLVGQPNAGEADPAYRLLLRARIRANRSSGTPEDLYSVFRAMFGGGAFVYTPGYNASFEFRVVRPVLTDAQEAIALGFLRDAKDAGVRAILEWQEIADADAFVMALSSSVAIQTVNGDLFIDVPGGDPDRFPPSGKLILDEGLAGEETVIYTHISGTFILQAPGVVNVHPVGAAVTYKAPDPPAESSSVGLGFPIATGLSVDCSAMDDHLFGADLSAFPASGTVIVDEGTAVEETLAYSSIVAGVELMLVGLAAHDHSTGAALVVVGTGGSLISAAEVT